MYVYIIHYGEIALKGDNRRSFENKLINNIDGKLALITDKKVLRKYGKLILEDENPEIKNLLAKTPGIMYFAVAKKTDLEYDNFGKAVLELIKIDFNTFMIDCRRGNKDFKMTSLEIERKLGGVVLEKFPNKKVKLNNPDLTIFVDISEKEAYFYTKKIKGVGGLPVGSSGKVVSLLSGGIDSPVAAYFAMKRGCEVILMHGFNVSLNPEKVKNKIINIAKKLSEYQINIILYFVPYKGILKEIVKSVSPKRRMLIFKRSIMRIANIIAKKHSAKAIINGDSIGQVASQTIDNINIVNNQSELPVLSPLIGMDKQEIIDKAIEIGTYDISIEPFDDCCSVLAGKNPETHGKQEIAGKMEKEINYFELEEEMAEELVMIKIN